MQNLDFKMQNGARHKSKVEPGRDLGKRTKNFALRIVRLYTSLPKSTTAQVIGKQLLRCGTSVGAQYREAECARSIAEFVSKLGSARQESRETCCWIELLAESGIVSAKRLAELHDESQQLFAMLTASINTAKRRRP